jgi:hypothetical protein
MSATAASSAGYGSSGAVFVNSDFRSHIAHSLAPRLPPSLDSRRTLLIMRPELAWLGFQAAASDGEGDATEVDYHCKVYLYEVLF